MYLHQLKPNIVKKYETKCASYKFEKVKYIVIKCKYCSGKRIFTKLRYKLNGKPAFCSRHCKISYCCTYGIKILQPKRKNKKEKKRKIDIRRFMTENNNIAYARSKQK